VIIAMWQSLLVAVLAVLVLKAAVTAFFLRVGGAQSAVAAETGVLMASPSETTLIVLGSATAAQLITRETAAFWQIVTAIGLTVTPLLAKLGRMAGSRVAGHEMTDKMDASLESAALGQVIVLGFGRVGRMVADMLDAHGKDYLAIDSDSDGVTAARKDGYTLLGTLLGQVATMSVASLCCLIPETTYSTLETVGITPATTVVAAPGEVAGLPGSLRVTP